MIAALHELSEEDLGRVLTEPKNAITKQYQKFFDMEDVRLEFTPDALKTIASEAVVRDTGARGLRAILEDVMLDIMYDLPSRPDIEAVIINQESIVGEGVPELQLREGKKKA